MAEEDKYYVGPMNEGQAQAWFQLGGDTIEKLEPRDISNLQLAMERNPAALPMPSGHRSEMLPGR